MVAQVPATSFQNYRVEEGLPSNTVYDVDQDKDGFIWFATDAGLCRYDGQYFRVFGAEDGLPDVDILDLFIDSQNRIWCNAYNGKIFYIKENRVFSAGNTPAFEHYPNEFWDEITEGPRGESAIGTKNILITRSAGTCIVHLSSLGLKSARVVYFTSSEHEGLQVVITQPLLLVAII